MKPKSTHVPWTTAEQEKLRQVNRISSNIYWIQQNHFPHRSVQSIRGKCQKLGLPVTQYQTGEVNPDHNSRWGGKVTEGMLGAGQAILVKHHCLDVTDEMLREVYVAMRKAARDEGRK